MTYFQEFGFTQELAIILAIDLSIAVILLAAMRYLQGWTINVDSTHELAQRDNFAFGISTAGVMLALGIVLTGAIMGKTVLPYKTEALNISCYGILGLVLIRLGRYLHDKIALNEIDKNAQILKGNLAVAIVDVGAAIATAIIIRAVLMWVEGLTMQTFIAIGSAFLISQLMLVLLTRVREKRYSRRNQEMPMQQALEQRHTALAIRHSGYLIAMALTFNAASHFVMYQPTAYVANVLGWLMYSVIMLVVLLILLALIKRLVLAKIDTAIEVEMQHNIGVATMELSICISVALLLAALMA